MSQKERFLVVGTGRCGSSLLCAILARAGANFDMPMSSEWDRRGGEYEHPLLIQAVMWLTRSKKVSQSPLPSRLRDYCLRRMRVTLDRLLKRALFMKSPELVNLVPTVVALGYRPKIILIYRDFSSYSFSRHAKNSYTFMDCVREYVDVNTTALMQLHMYGGCVVSYEDIVNSEEREWITTLARITGLSYDAICKSREVLVQGAREIPVLEPLIEVEPKVKLVYRSLQRLKGQLIDPSIR